MNFARAKHFRIWFIRVGPACSLGALHVYQNNSDEGGTTNGLQLVLPKHVNDLLVSHFPNTSLPNVITMIQNPKHLSQMKSQLLKYSGSAFLAGRSMDSVIIFMAGASGVGKSSTINALFEEKMLCPTNSMESETKDPAIIQKEMVVTAESPTVVGYLKFVDVPGTSDSNALNEARNIAAIRKFMKSRNELSSRDSLIKALSPYPAISSYVASIRKKAYPNIVLIVESASDKRFAGPDSTFVKTLKALRETGDFVDLERPNVIVVLTHALTMGINEAAYKQDLEEKTAVISRLLFEHLGIEAVEIVAVENEPEKYNHTDQVGGFTVLPDGSKSHLNLFEAMLRRFDTNQDLLGRLFISWYFGTDCPEKTKNAEIVTSTEELNKLDLAAGAQIQTTVQRNDFNLQFVPQFQIHSLGYAYCPVTEEIKPRTPLATSGDFKFVRCFKSNFKIPKEFISSSDGIYKANHSELQMMSHYTKQEYQTSMAERYGLDAGINLVVRGNAAGRWVESGSILSSKQTAIFEILRESRVSRFKINNPDNQKLTDQFRLELHSLPLVYGEKTALDYRAFFDKWGGYFIYDQYVGGAISLKCELQQEFITRDKWQEVTAKVRSDFNKVCAAVGVKGEKFESNESLHEHGISNKRLRILGGNTDTCLTTDTITPAEFKVWLKSVSQNPVELKHTIKLYPYYNFLPSNGKRYKSLRQATEEYLNGELQKRIEKAAKQNEDRNEIAKKETEKAVSANGWWCTIL